MATIGNWEVLIEEDREFPRTPGNPADGKIRVITYSFTYVPRNFTLPHQEIFFLEFRDDDGIREFLVERLAILKTEIVDKLPS